LAEALALRDVAGYVLKTGLVPAQAVVSGDLVIRDLSSRHRTMSVERQNGPGFILKQGVDLQGEIAIRREAAVYARLIDLGGGAARYLPPFVRFDEERALLVLGRVVAVEDLRSYHLRQGRFPVGAARALGTALGQIHRHGMRPTHQAPEQPELAPTTLSLHRPGLELFREASAATFELIKIVQASPALADGLDELRACWRRLTVIHVDVKWDNCLLSRPEGRGSRLAIRIIDWETASLGDPCWDIGSALSQYLSTWVFSIPVTGQAPPEDFPALARYPLEDMQPALRACWHAYARAMRLAGPIETAWLSRTVRYAAARLVQSALEAAQMSLQLTSSLVLHLQLAENMLRRPHEAAVHLLGLAQQSRVTTAP
jgi:aminoglycoside phosphotransferase (APT) family kinase protein